MIFFAVKQELKLENRMNGLDIKSELGTESNSLEDYPQSLDEYFQRANAQMFMLQVSQMDALIIA